MSSAVAELADKVKTATGKMFFNQKISFIETHYFADGSEAKRTSHDSEIVGAFKWLSVVLMGGPTTVKDFKRDSVTFPVSYSSDLNMMIEGRRVEKSTYLLRGDPNDIKPLLEYLWWWNESKHIPGMPNISGPCADVPTYLPSIIMSKNRIAVLNDVDKKILEYYGIDDIDIANLAEVQEWRKQKWNDGGFWLDFVSANELWFEARRGVCLKDILNEHLLNHTFA